jgi:hypothetical protein
MCDVLMCVTWPELSASCHVLSNNHLKECGDVITSAFVYIHTLPAWPARNIPNEDGS